MNNNNNNTKKKTSRPRGRPSGSDKDRKKTVTIRMTDATREMLIKDFGRLQWAIDWLSVHHKGEMEDEAYQNTIKEHLEYMKGA